MNYEWIVITILGAACIVLSYAVVLLAKRIWNLEFEHLVRYRYEVPDRSMFMFQRGGKK